MLSYDDAIAELYRGLLGREPDPAGLRGYAARLHDGVTLGTLARAFVRSEEFSRKRAAGDTPMARVDHDPPLDIAMGATAAQMRALWSHVAQAWTRMGETDPYHSVLVDPRYHMAGMGDAVALDAFYATGQGDVDRLRAWLARHGRSLSADMTCAEYGCGVGRVTGWLAAECGQIRAFDISPTHLALAAARLAAAGVANVDLHQVRGAVDLAPLAGIDVFFSLIVLQHSPPPIMHAVLDRAFAGLNPGGVAFFQLPTHCVGYRFAATDYLAAPESGQSMEMHVLPQPAIYALAQRHGLVPLEIQQDPLSGSFGTSHCLLLHKPPARPGRRKATAAALL